MSQAHTSASLLCERRENLVLAFALFYFFLMSIIFNMRQQERLHDSVLCNAAPPWLPVSQGGGQPPAEGRYIGFVFLAKFLFCGKRGDLQARLPLGKLPVLLEDRVSLRGPPGLAKAGSRTRKPESTEDVQGKRGRIWEVKCSPSIFPRGSGPWSSGGLLVLLEEAVGFLVLMGRTPLTGAYLCFLNSEQVCSVGPV